MEREKDHLKSEEAAEICSTEESPKSATCKGVRQSDGEIERSRFRSPKTSNRKRTTFRGGNGESEKLATEVDRNHIREASDILNLSMGTVWKVPRKNLKWKAFKPHKVQVLSPANKLARKSACEFWLTFPESWFERVIWTDEKWFVLRSPPHSQNNRFWAPANQHEVLECNKAHGEKIIA